MALLKQKEGVSDGHIVHSPPPQPGTLSYTEPISLPSPKVEKQSVPKRFVLSNARFIVCSVFFQSGKDLH